jgi:putative tricarboxylic transport membrane protein
MIPMLSLAIPGNASTAVLLAALILHGVRPGPMLMTQEATLVWGLIASMFVGNIMLLIMNLPLAPLFASLLRVPYVYLAPGILVISLVGAYAATLSMSTVWMCIFFGVLGYLMMKFDIPRPPLVLALVLAPLLETSLRQSLLLSFGSPMIFVERRSRRSCWSAWSSRSSSPSCRPSGADAPDISPAGSLSYDH